MIKRLLSVLLCLSLLASVCVTAPFAVKANNAADNDIPFEDLNNPAGAVVSIAVTTMPSKLTYVVGDAFVADGMVVTATYADTSVAPIIGYNVLADLSVPGKCTVTVTYRGHEDAFTVSVGLATPAVKVTNGVDGPVVSWKAIVGAEGYLVYRRQLSGGKWSGWTRLTKKAITAISYTDKTAKSGTTYRYTAKAVTASVDSAIKDSADFQCLSTPKVTVANSTAGMSVKWGKVTGAAGYLVYRRQLSGGKWSGWTRLTKKAITAISYTDKTAKSGTTYRYTAKAVTASVDSAIKDSASLVRLSTPTVTIANSTSGMSVKWSKVTGAKQYYVYRRQLNGSKWSGWSRIKTYKSSVTAFTDTTVKNGTYYRYTVKAVYSSSQVGDIQSTGTVRYLTAPKVKLSRTSAGIKATWSKNSAASKYVVYRRTYNAKTKKWSGWSSIATTKSNAYVDKKAKKGTTYRYMVKTVSGSHVSSYVSTGSYKR